jgi:hypothetical protein
MFMIEAVRSLGMAARFVSGYFHVRADSESHSRGGNTHAWVQVYIPGSGWVDFDPSSGIAGNRDLARGGGGRCIAGDSTVRCLDRLPSGQFGDGGRGSRQRGTCAGIRAHGSASLKLTERLSRNRRLLPAALPAGRI